MVYDLAMTFKSLHLLKILRLVVRGDSPTAPQGWIFFLIITQGKGKVLLVMSKLIFLKVVQILSELLSSVRKFFWEFRTLSDLLNLWLNFGRANWSANFAKRLYPLLHGYSLRIAKLLTGLLCQFLLLHILPHIENMAENNSFVEFQICLRVTWSQLCVVLSELPSMSLLGVYGVELYIIIEQ